MEEAWDIIRLQALEEMAKDKPSSAQRRAYYRLGRSRSWVKKYLKDKRTASKIIGNSIEEMTELKNGK